ncbi:hypothetical protein MMC25_007111 [Agyrium rufum]|nr:hypothetical protein [Agyrium rufum]
MVILGSRIHFYEINDQSWFPSYFREKVQAGLTLLWTFRVPFIQSTSPAALVAQILQEVLGPKIYDYEYVDFCAGAGGPTPFIEREINRRLGSDESPSLSSAEKDLGNGHASGLIKQQQNGTSAITERGRRGRAAPSRSASSSQRAVNFVMTDIAPHIPAWAAATKESPNLHYVPTPVDASSAPSNLLSLTESPLKRSPSSSTSTSDPRIFRLYSLAFHHFPDSLARPILNNTLTHSSGFAIFELQERTFSSLLTVTLIWPLLWAIAPFYFWRDPGFLFFTYVIPVIPFVLVFDGWVSSFRTRTEGEVGDLIAACEDDGSVLGRDGEEGKERGGGGKGVVDEWEFKSGEELHTWPTGKVSWFVGVRRQQ